MAAHDAIRDLLSAFESGNAAAAVDAFLTTLPPPTLSALIDAIRHPPPAATPAGLLRALWCSATLRPTLLTHICATAPPHSSLAEHRLLDEVHLLLAADARRTAVSEHTRLRSLGLCATAVVRHARSARSPHTAPLLICCARAATAVGTPRARAVRARIIKYLVVFLSVRENLTLSPIIALLEGDVVLGRADEAALLKAVDLFAARVCEAANLPELFRAVLMAMGRAPTRERARLLGLVCLVLARRGGEAGRAALSDMLVVLGVAALDLRAVCYRLVDAFMTMFRVRDGESRRSCEARGLNCEGIGLVTAHVSVLYFMLGCAPSEDVRDAVATLLERVVEDKQIPLDLAQPGSSSAHAEQPDGWRRSALLDGLKVPAVCNMGNAVTTFFEAQLWAPRGIPRAVCADVLYEIFLCIPGCRGRVLSSIFTACTSRNTEKPVVLSCCSLLERLIDTPRAALLLRHLSDVVLGSLKYVDFMPDPFDCRVVSAVARFAMPVPLMKDELFIFLNKATTSRQWKLQRAACSGLLAVVENHCASEETWRDACKTLKIMLQLSEITVRSYLVTRLVDILQRSPTEIERFAELCDLVAERFISMDTSSGKPRGNSDEDSTYGACECIDFTKNFEILGKTYFLRDDLPLLLRFCAAHRVHSHRTRRFFRRLAEYLCNTDQVVRDACSTTPTEVPVVAKVSQLCSLLETLVCVDSFPASSSLLRTYAITLVIRDKLSAVRKRMTRSGNQSGLSVRDDSEVFAAMTCRAVMSFETESMQNVLRKNYLSLTACVNAVEALSRVDVTVAVLGVVQAEALSRLLAALLSDMGEKDAGNLDEALGLRLIDLVRIPFSRSCAWVRHGVQAGEGLLERRGADDSVVTRITDESHLDGASGNNVSAAGEISSSQVPACPYVLSVTLQHDDARNALDPQHVAKVQSSTIFSIRQSSMKVLLAVLSETNAVTAWPAVSRFMQDAAPCFRRNLCQGEDSALVACGRRLPTASSGAGDGDNVEISVISALTALFCLEFEHSLSISLTVSYIDLFRLLLERLSRDKNGSKCTKVKEIVASTFMGLLRDYSIRHVLVLRGMLNLLLKSLACRAASEFSASLLRWLGNDPCLLSFKHAAIEDASVSCFNGNLFDSDIIEEAIDFDRSTEESNRSSSADVLVPPKGSASTGSSNVELSNDVQTRLETVPRTQSSEKDAVRSLCLNETEEGALVAIACVLDHLSRATRDVLDRHRRFPNALAHQVDDLVVQRDVIGALRGLFGTSFCEVTTSLTFRIPLSHRKKIGVLILALTEMAEIQIRVAAKNIRKITSEKEGYNRLISASRLILEFLVREQKVSMILGSMENEQSARRAFLNEKLDATATAFLVCIRDEEAAEDLMSFRSIIQERLSSNEKLVKGQNSEMLRQYRIRSSHNDRQSKKQKVRSRNRAVDGWLLDEKGDDNYADLEEFIVPMDDVDNM